MLGCQRSNPSLRALQAKAGWQAGTVWAEEDLPLLASNGRQLQAIFWHYTRGQLPPGAEGPCNGSVTVGEDQWGPAPLRGCTELSL